MKKIYCMFALLTVVTGLVYSQETKTDKTKESNPGKVGTPYRGPVTTTLILSTDRFLLPLN